MLVNFQIPVNLKIHMVKLDEESLFRSVRLLCHLIIMQVYLFLLNFALHMLRQHGVTLLLRILAPRVFWIDFVKPVKSNLSQLKIWIVDFKSFKITESHNCKWIKIIFWIKLKRNISSIIKGVYQIIYYVLILTLNGKKSVW